MGETLTKQRRVDDEVSWYVKSFRRGRKPQGLTVPVEEAPANSVPAAAVIRRVQALSGIIGRKELVGGLASRVLNLQAQPGARARYCHG